MNDKFKQKKEKKINWPHSEMQMRYLLNFFQYASTVELT